MKWSYGVMTVAERMTTTLPCTLASLRAGGFEEPRLFVDVPLGVVVVDFPDGLLGVCRFPAVGVTANWILSMWELYLREPHADRYALFQDDLVCYRNLRQYLERSAFPRQGYQNLFTFSNANNLITEKSAGVGWVRGAPLNPGSEMQCGRGALGLVFDRDGVVTLLSSRALAMKPQAADPRMAKRKIDGGVVTAMNLAGYSEYIHNPSLLQHTGRVSTIGNVWAWGENDTQGKCDHASGIAQTFLGEDWDALRFLEDTR